MSNAPEHSGSAQVRVDVLKMESVCDSQGNPVRERYRLDRYDADALGGGIFEIVASADMSPAQLRILEEFRNLRRLFILCVLHGLGRIPEPPADADQLGDLADIAVRAGRRERQWMMPQ